MTNKRTSNGKGKKEQATAKAGKNKQRQRQERTGNGKGRKEQATAKARAGWVRVCIPTHRDGTAMDGAPDLLWRGSRKTSTSKRMAQNGAGGRRGVHTFEGGRLGC